MNYGTVTQEGSFWKVECVPHVSMRLKRLFPSLSNQYRELRLSDTPEVCRDLEWFMERYPMEVKPENALKAGASLHRERTALVDELLSRRSTAPPVPLAQPLREYQQLAVAVADARRSLLLADDVGLGKTASAIGVLATANKLPAVVVTLTHLPRQWQAEIKKFAPHLTTHVVKKTVPYDLTGNPSRGPQMKLPTALPDVIIISYSKLTGWSETLAAIARTVIFDEVQELRHAGTQRHAAASHIAGSMVVRMGLSATPIYNYGGEIHSVFEAIAPGELGTLDEFTKTWCTAGYNGKVTVDNPAAFGAYLRESGLMLRRTRAQVGRELPELTKIPQTVDADAAALDRVSASCAELARAILTRGEGSKGEKMQMSEEFSNRLRQATGIAKAPYVAEFVRLLVESGERVVLYGWHREVYSIWLDRLKDLDPVLYTGSESIAQKEAAKEAFTNGSSRVLIISLRSGAGLDGLQHVGRTVVFGELDWSPGVHEQCIGRIYRDGQPQPVMAYYMIAESGADPIIAYVLGIKREQMEGIRDENIELVEKLQTDGGHVRRMAEAYLASRGEVVATEVAS